MKKILMEPQSTALLVIDMQNSYCHEGGALARAGQNIGAKKAIIPHVRKLISFCEEAGMTVIWTLQEYWPDDKAMRSSKAGLLAERIGKGIAVQGSWDFELVDSIKDMLHEKHIVMKKHRQSAFYNTSLEQILKMKGISTLIVSGVSTNICVESTVRDAHFRDYDVILVEDCIASGDRDLHEATIKNVGRYFGVVTSLQDLPKFVRREEP